MYPCLARSGKNKKARFSDFLTYFTCLMKVLELLHSLEKKDWHWLGKFISSPINNQHAAVRRLFDVFRKKIPAETDTVFSENLHRTLFGNFGFDAGKIHHVSNYLLRVVEDYLAWDEWQRKEGARLYYLLQACRRRGLDKPFRSVLERLNRYLDKQPHRNPDHYRLRYAVALEEYDHSMQTGRSATEHLQPLSDWHDVAFIAEKLKNACILISRRRVLHREFDTGLLPAVLELVRVRPQLLDIPAIAVYYFGYLALNEPETDAHFFALKERLRVDGHLFPVAELRDIYLLAINFCIHRINLRQEVYLREVFDLYRAGLESGVFLENNQLSRFTYTNIALAALRLQEFDWTLRFLEEYREKLPETQRAGAYAFNLARYHCERGDYDRAMPLLQAMDFDDVLHNLTAKAMLIRMYYETGAANALDSLLASLETYLRRKGQLGEQQKTAYHNMIRFVRKLNALPPADARARQMLRQEVLGSSLVAEKDWLLRIISE